MFNKKSVLKKILIFILILSALFVTNYTYSRYSTTPLDKAIIGIARFNVKVNNKDIVENETFNLNVSSNANTYNNKMAPGTEGYYEIVIDPTGTEVSLDYELKFDIENIKNHSDKISIKYTVDDEEVTVNNNTLTGSINLKTLEHGFTESDKVSIKLEWEWEDEEIKNPEIEDFDETDISVECIVKQKID